MMPYPVYLDNNATTRVADEVVEEMTPYLTSLYGNPSSLHAFGAGVAKSIKKAREQVAALLGASDPAEVTFTSGGTEGDNLAIRGILEAHPTKKHIVVTPVEHQAVLNFAQVLKRRGYLVTEVGVDSEGLLDLEELRSAIRPDTALVSVMYANNETGVIFPIRDVAEIVKEKGSLLHVDAVQAAGKVPLDVKRVPVDLLVISGHKFHAPKGVGALFVRRGTKIQPQIIGGHQEKNRRSGTENVASIVGMGKASELALSQLKDEGRVSALRDQLEEGILQRCPIARVNGHRELRVPNTLNIGFEGFEGESLVLLLDHYGICASTGSACTSGSVDPSHVLRAMKLPPPRAQGEVRFSLSRYTTDAEIAYTLEKIPEALERLRSGHSEAKTDTWHVVEQGGVYFSNRG
jgi:cysteine desulfurase